MQSSYLRSVSREFEWREISWPTDELLTGSTRAMIIAKAPFRQADPDQNHPNTVYKYSNDHNRLCQHLPNQVASVTEKPRIPTRTPPNHLTETVLCSGRNHRVDASAYASQITQ